MRTIHKYELQFGSRVILNLPDQYRILHVASQGDQPCIWAEVDTSRPVHPVTFIIEGTGFDLDRRLEDSEISYHVGTWLAHPFVWHLYQIVKNDWRDWDLG